MRVHVRLGPDPGSGIMAMVGYSLAGHVVALVLLILAPRIIPHRPPPPLVLTARIVSLPQAGASSPGPPVRPAAEPGVTPTERARKAAEARKAPKPAAKPIPPDPDVPKPDAPKPPAL